MCAGGGGGLQQLRIRVYSRNSDPAVVNALGDAFQEWLKRKWRGEVQATPGRRCEQPGANDVTQQAEKKRKRLFLEPRDVVNQENQHPSQPSLSAGSR